MKQQIAVNARYLFTFIEDRIIMLGSAIDDNVANSIVSGIILTSSRL